MNRKIEIKTIDNITLKGRVNGFRIEDDDTITYDLVLENGNAIKINEKEIFIIAYV